MTTPQQRRQCTSRSKRTGERCGATPPPGAEVCRWHGGAAPQVQAAAAERRLDEQLDRALAELDVAPCADPLEALSLLAGQILAFKDQLAAQVNRLTELRYSASGSGAEQIRGEVLLYERALDRATRVLSVIARLDIENRLAAIEERQVDAVVAAIEAGIRTAGVTGESEVEQVRAVVATHLRSVK